MDAAEHRAQERRHHHRDHRQRLAAGRDAQAGHIHLAADHPEDYDRYSPMVSRLLHLMIIDILTTCVALRIGGDKLQPLLQEMKNNLRSKRYT